MQEESLRIQSNNKTRPTKIVREKEHLCCHMHLFNRENKQDTIMPLMDQVRKQLLNTCKYINVF